MNSMEIVNEYDQIRKSLKAVREILKGEVNRNITEQVEFPFSDDETNNKSGQESSLDKSKAKAFVTLKSEISDGVKNNVLTSCDNFLSSTNLNFKSAKILIYEDKVMIKIDNILNPELDSLQYIKFDTDNENPILMFVQGEFDLTSDFVDVISTIKANYNNNQNGRKSIITSLKEI